MYDNIGGKVKGLAKFIGVGGAVLSGLAFFICLIIAGAANEWDTMAGALITLAILIPGCIIASYPLYCAGDTNEKISQLIEQKNTVQMRAVAPSGKRCPKCGQQSASEAHAFCDKCGASLNN